MAFRVDPNTLSDLQSNTRNIRNFCIIAHVDHGKTTLSDSMVSSNGLFSQRLAGKLRYLDSTDEEQSRGITMHSSAISLLYRPEERKPILGKKSETEIEKIAKPESKTDSETINKSETTETEKQEEYLINLVDSPGHIDFSSDVSTATRLCDGALILVDALEGVRTQTRAVLYKALRERMRPCLVLNKLDRMVLEMRLTPTEAFHHLKRIVENINALAYSLVVSELRSAEALQGSKQEQNQGNERAEGKEQTNAEKQRTKNESDASLGIDEREHPLFAEWTFAPEKGNVIFCSAVDCWGFGLPRFATIWAQKLEVPRGALLAHMFDDCMFNTKTKKIIKCDPHDMNSKPMFASMILEPLWQMYEVAVIEGKPGKAAKMAQRGLGVELTQKEISLTDPRSTLSRILNTWLPLSDAILRMVVRCMPDPIDGQHNRFETLFGDAVSQGSEAITTNATNGVNGVAVAGVDYPPNGNSNAVEASLRSVLEDCRSCSTAPDGNVLAFVSKMTPVAVSELSARDREWALQQQGEDGQQKEVFVGLARIFSGVLRSGDSKSLYALGGRYDPRAISPANAATAIAPVTDDDGERGTKTGPPAHLTGPHLCTPMTAPLGLYLCLGPSFYPVDEAPAGSIVAIFGLEGTVLKTATLASTWASPPMRGISFQAKPMVQVAVEPTCHQDLPRLEAGLQALYQYDPVVEVRIDDSGQHSMVCLGELHLEHCLKALQERFAKCDVKASEPIVAFRETVLSVPVSTSTSFRSAISASGNAKTGKSGSGKAEKEKEKVMSLRMSLPHPWCDIEGISSASGGVHVLQEGGNVSINFRCAPLPAHSLLALEGASAGGGLAELASHVNNNPCLRDLLVSENSENGENNGNNGNNGNGEGTSTSVGASLANMPVEAAQAWKAFSNGFFESADGSEISDCGPFFVPTEGETAGDNQGEGDYNARSLGLLPRMVAMGPTKGGINTNCMILSPQAAFHVHPTSVPQRGDMGAVEQSHSSVFKLDKDKDTDCSVDCADRECVGRIGIVSLEKQPLLFAKIWNRMHSSVSSGFQMACGSGPLMREPMHGVGFVLEKVDIVLELALQSDASLDELKAAGCESARGTWAGSSTSNNSSNNSPSPSSSAQQLSIFGGQLMALVMESLHLSMLSCPVRVVEPVYMCNLQCDNTQLGSLYGVLTKRRGQVVEEDIIDGTSLFLLTAHLPVVESFGFAQELLKRTSGDATAPQMLFSHWAVRDSLCLELWLVLYTAVVIFHI